MGVDTEGFILDMQRAPSGASLNYSHRPWTQLQGQCIAPSYAAILDMTSGGRGDIATYGGGVDLLATWTWIDLAQGHAASNSTLEFQNLECYVLRESTRQWVRYFGDRLFSSAALWGDANGPFSFVSPTDSPPYFTAAGGIAKVNYSRLAATAIEAWQDGFQSAADRNNALLSDARCLHIRVQYRVAKINVSGADDRANARFRICQGADWDNSTHYNYRGHGQVWNGFARADTASRDAAIAQGDYRKSYPGYSLEGMNGSWKPCEYNPADPDGWFYASMSTIFPANVTAGIYGPWATALGIGDFQQSSTWAQPPFAITAAEFRNNPPPDISGTPGPPPSPPPTPTPGVDGDLSWITHDAGGLSWVTSATGTNVEILNATLPLATIGAVYVGNVVASKPSTFTVHVGSLPAGLSLNSSTGAVTGTPTTASVGVTFTIRATAGSETDDQVYTVVVSAAPVIATTALPGGVVGVGYSQTMIAAGATPINWTLTATPALPGFVINASTGEITGTAAAAGEYTLGITATNSVDSAIVVIPFSISQPLAITTPSALPAMVVGVPYSVQLLGVGAPPIFWTAPVINLPAGLSLSAAGLLSGTPTTVSSGSFVATASNPSASTTRTMTWAVTALANEPVVTTQSLPAGTVGVAYLTALAATGATPIAWSASGVPAGLALVAGTKNKIPNPLATGAVAEAAGDVATGTQRLVNPTVLSGTPWTRNNVTAVSAPAAFWTIAKSNTTANAYVGQTVSPRGRLKIEVALLAGTSSQAGVGIYDTILNSWGGLDALSSAVVVSGPGSISRANRALFSVTGLSAVTPTVVQIDRIDNSDSLYVYPDLSSSVASGASVLIGGLKVVSGTQGSLPPGWSQTGSATGLTRTVQLATVDGQPGVAVRYRGTAVGGSLNIVVGAASMAVVPASAYSRSLSWRLAAGSAAPLTYRALTSDEFNSSLGYLGGMGGGTLALPTASVLRVSNSGVARAGAAFANTYLSFTVAAGTVDLTLEIGAPQFEQAAAATFFADPALSYISGTPTASGFYLLGVAASNSLDTASAALALSVNATPVAPANDRSGGWSKFIRQ